jgi:hypothetical protein
MSELALIKAVFPFCSKALTIPSLNFYADGKIHFLQADRNNVEIIFEALQKWKLGFQRILKLLRSKDGLYDVRFFA